MGLENINSNVSVSSFNNWNFSNNTSNGYNINKVKKYNGIDINNYNLNYNMEYYDIEDIDNKGNNNEFLDLYVETGATNIVRFNSVVSGFYSVVEFLGDGVIWAGGTLASGVLDLFGQDEEALKLRKDTKDIIKKDVIGDINKWYYEETELGRIINEKSNLKYDSDEAQRIKDITIKITEFTAATVIAVGTGGASAYLLPIVGFLEGTGKSANKRYQDPNNEGYETGAIVLDGIGSAFNWYSGGKLGAGALNFIKAVSQCGLKTTVSTFSSIAKEVIKNFKISNLKNKDLWTKAMKSGILDVDNFIDSAGVVVDNLTDYANGGELDILKMLKELLATYGLNCFFDGATSAIIDFDVFKEFDFGLDVAINSDSFARRVNGNLEVDDLKNVDSDLINSFEFSGVDMKLNINLMEELSKYENVSLEQIESLRKNGLTDEKIVDLLPKLEQNAEIFSKLDGINLDFSNNKVNFGNLLVDSCYFDDPDGNKYLSSVLIDLFNKNPEEALKFYESIYSSNIGNFLTNCTTNEMNFLSGYTGSLHSNINSLLRNNEIPESANAIDSCINKYMASVGLELDDMVLYRGISTRSIKKVFDLGEIDINLSDSEEVLSILKSLEGKSIVDKGYMSTSISESIAEDFLKDDLGIEFKIAAPKGTNGIFLEEITHSKNEQEFLLARNTNLLISDVSLKKSSKGGQKIVVSCIASNGDEVSENLVDGLNLFDTSSDNVKLTDLFGKEIQVDSKGKSYKQLVSDMEIIEKEKSKVLSELRKIYVGNSDELISDGVKSFEEFLDFTSDSFDLKRKLINLQNLEEQLIKWNNQSNLNLSDLDIEDSLLHGMFVENFDDLKKISRDQIDGENILINGKNYDVDEIYDYLEKYGDLNVNSLNNLLEKKNKIVAELINKFKRFNLTKENIDYMLTFMKNSNAEKIPFNINYESYMVDNYLLDLSDIEKSQILEVEELIENIKLKKPFSMEEKKLISDLGFGDKVVYFIKNNDIDIVSLYNDSRSRVKMKPSYNGNDRYIMEMVSIADIVGYAGCGTTGYDNILRMFNRNFGGNGGISSRSDSMLLYDTDNIMQGLSDSFKGADQIQVERTDTGEYLLTSGFHRYTLLRTLFLSESLNASESELKRLIEKYRIPVQVS